MKKLLFLLGLFLALPIEISAAVPASRQSSVGKTMVIIIVMAALAAIIYGLLAWTNRKNRPRK